MSFFLGPADLKRGEGSAWQVQCVEDGSLNRVSTETFRWAVKVAFSGADLDDVMIWSDFDHVAGRLTVKELVGSSATSGVEAWKWWQFAKEKSPGTVVKFVTSSRRLAEECFILFYQLLDVEHSGVVQVPALNLPSYKHMPLYVQFVGLGPGGTPKRLTNLR